MEPRINHMHTLWTKIFGYAVHPKIPINKPDLCVADVGTGTGQVVTFQWGDPDFESVRIDRTRPDTKTENLTEMFELLSVQDPRLKPTWFTELPSLFSTAGFVDIETDKNDCPPHTAFPPPRVGANDP
ncbi:hypothetical protein VM1G_11939 [Cytospora mali]|uniref:Uncharacterized protein n=1 Tax=Cytospora mali TaxID=578113 RepID=A0A194WCC3_CYTMA|nr:hypothetical protein VM1G_11939 [Valsa mali]